MFAGCGAIPCKFVANFVRDLTDSGLETAQVCKRGMPLRKVNNKGLVAGHNATVPLRVL